MASDLLEDAEYDAATISQHPVHLVDGGLPVGEEHQRKLAYDQIEAGMRDWQLLSSPLVPLYSEALSFSCRAGDYEHIWVEIEADDLGLEGGALYDPLGNYRRVAGNWNDWASDPRREPVATRTVTPAEVQGVTPR